MKEKRESGPEKAVLVGVAVGRQSDEELESSIEELGLLVRTAGAEVAGTVIQKRARIDPAFYMGKGKVEIVAECAREHGAALVVFDEDLTPAQVRNLERETGCRVIDRSELILDIFALRAKTRQARVQVELAQLEYLRPRLTRMWTHLERYEGGIGMRGPGEKQLEIDRRLIDRRIRDLRRELASVEKQKELERFGRRNVFRVALVGYTNAGKSTLLNFLTDAGTYEADELFATLDTKTRSWNVRPGRNIVISDTVGFLDKLPHHLIASFHATLGEAIEADLMLHVIDASHPRALDQGRAVLRVLKEVGADTAPLIHVLNKMDLVADGIEIAELRAELGAAVEVSARTGTGMDGLERAVLDEVDRYAVEDEVELSAGMADQGRVLAWVRAHAHVLEESMQGESIRLRLRLTKSGWEKLARMGAVRAGDPAGSD